MAEKKITEAAVLALFREEKVSISRGAQLLSVPIQDFMYLTEPTPMPEPMLTTLPLP